MQDSTKDFIWSIIQQITVALALFLIIYLFLFQPHQVDGSSMEPNFISGEYLLTDKISYKLITPKRGDVVVFHAPPTRREDYIKRIVALPGETIAIHDGKVFINNQLLPEEYLPSSTDTFGGFIFSQNINLTLGRDEYFVLGDNRNLSKDSREFGAIKKRDLVGRAWIVYWPPTRTRIVPNLLRN